MLTDYDDEFGKEPTLEERYAAYRQLLYGDRLNARNVKVIEDEREQKPMIEVRGGVPSV